MICIESIADMQTARSNIASDITIGFVPTMGALHAGHASLIAKANSENDLTIVSIFINPTQFNEQSDYNNYPISLEQDKNICSKLEVDYLFLPSRHAMYPHSNTYFIDAKLPITNIFEGKARPGHFSGMLTVVMKLLQLVQPTRAYFGEKDYQQSILVRMMAEYFFIPVKVIACPTIRNKAGLPLSSRNSKLNATQMQLAEDAYKIINTASADTLTQTKDKLAQLGITVEYLDLYQGRIYSAIRIGKIRLIDNKRHF